MPALSSTCPPPGLSFGRAPLTAVEADELPCGPLSLVKRFKLSRSSCAYEVLLSCRRCASLSTFAGKPTNCGPPPDPGRPRLMDSVKELSPPGEKLGVVSARAVGRPCLRQQSRQQDDPPPPGLERDSSAGSRCNEAPTAPRRAATNHALFQEKGPTIWAGTDLNNFCVNHSINRLPSEKCSRAKFDSKMEH